MRCKPPIKKPSYTTEELKEAVKNSTNITETVKKLNLKRGSGSSIKKRILDLNIDITHFIKKNGMADKPSVNRKDLSKEKFGLLQPLYIDSTINNKKSLIWVCQCDCGNITRVMSRDIVSHNTSSCGCQQHFVGNKSKRWKGYGEIGKHTFDKIKISAQRRNIEFNITIEEIWGLFLKQNRKCILSGRILHFGTTLNNNTTASLDRIDNTKGYCLDNVQWVHKDINRMKWIFGNKQFLDLCREVVNHNDEKT